MGPIWGLQLFSLRSNTLPKLMLFLKLLRFFRRRQQIYQFSYFCTFPDYFISKALNILFRLDPLGCMEPIESPYCLHFGRCGDVLKKALQRYNIEEYQEMVHCVVSDFEPASSFRDSLHYIYAMVLPFAAKSNSRSHLERRMTQPVFSPSKESLKGQILG